MYYISVNKNLQKQYETKSSHIYTGNHHNAFIPCKYIFKFYSHKMKTQRFF